MAYALVPEGYKLQKVTKQQKEVVDKHVSNEAVQAFLDGPASGELVKAVALVVTPIVLLALAKQIDLPDVTSFIDKQLEKVPGFDLSALGDFNI